MKTKYIGAFILAFCFLFSTNILADVVTFEPETDNGVVYEYYLDMDGKVVKQKTVSTVYNNVYTKVAPAIDGYVCMNARINENDLYYDPKNVNYNEGISVSLSSFNTKGDYVIFFYAEDKYNRGYPDDSTVEQDVTINYYDNSTGKKIDYDILENQVIGENFEFSPSLSKTFNEISYRFVKSVPDVDSDNDLTFMVTRTKANNVINLYYNQGKSTDRYITVHHVDLDSGLDFDKDIISNVQVGSTYTYSLTSKGGYNFVSSSPTVNGLGTSISLKVSDDNDDNHIYCYYRKNDLVSDSNNWYDGNNQYYVSPTDTFYGDSYIYNVPLRSDGIALNTSYYYSFANGYSNNYYYPNNKITRAEAAQMLYNTVYDKTNGKIGFAFKDLNTSSWYYDPISYLCSVGIMKGYSDNTIRPNNYITRAEFIKMATELKGFEDSTITLNFKDVQKTDWFYYYVKAGVNLNLLNGYNDNTFRPNNSITRAEATKIVDTMIGRNLYMQNKYRDVYFRDVPTTNWAYPYVKMATGVYVD